MIHYRFLLGSVSDYPKLYQNIYRALKPGGYFEISEMECGTFSDDGTVTPDSPSVRWWNWLQEAFTKIGRRIPEIIEYRTMLEAAGFTNIHDRMLKRPTNDWPKDPKMKEIGRVCWYQPQSIGAQLTVLCVVYLSELPRRPRGLHRGAFHSNPRLEHGRSARARSTSQS